MKERMEHRIGNFVCKKRKDLIEHPPKTEPQLLRMLNFEQELELAKDSASREALFGYGSLRSDFRPKEDNNTIIEVKYVRERRGKKGSKQYNECEVKNALSQIIEQALCKQVRNAILVVIDSGRAKNRDWNKREKMFTSMFKKNPLDIRLSIVRIKLDLGQSTVTYRVI